MLETHPKLAGWVARDLLTWQDWSFAEPLAELRSHETTLDGPSIFAIDCYLGRAWHHYKLPWSNRGMKNRDQVFDFETQIKNQKPDPVIAPLSLLQKKPPSRH